jgi:hypothetical protein
LNQEALYVRDVDKCTGSFVMLNWLVWFQDEMDGMTIPISARTNFAHHMQPPRASNHPSHSTTSVQQKLW